MTRYVCFPFWYSVVGVRLMLLRLFVHVFGGSCSTSARPWSFVQVLDGSWSSGLVLVHSDLLWILVLMILFCCWVFMIHEIGHLAKHPIAFPFPVLLYKLTPNLTNTHFSGPAHNREVAERYLQHTQEACSQGPKAWRRWPTPPQDPSEESCQGTSPR